MVTPSTSMLFIYYQLFSACDGSHEYRCQARHVLITFGDEISLTLFSLLSRDPNLTSDIFLVQHHVRSRHLRFFHQAYPCYLREERSEPLDQEDHPLRV